MTEQTPGSERFRPIFAGKWRLYGVSAAVAIAVVAIAIMTFGAAGRARRIAAKNAAARGGLSAWGSVKSMSLLGKLEAGVRRDPVRLAVAYQRQILAKGSPHRLQAPQEPKAEPPVQLPFVMELKRPRLSRLEIAFRGQTAVQVYDGKEGWKLRPFLGRREVEPYDAEELRQAAQQADLDGHLINYAAKGSKVVLEGTEKVDGRDAYNIKVTLANGQVRHVWVDTDSYLDVKVDGTRRMDGTLRPVWTYLRDYRSVNGLMVPHLLETVVDGVSGSEKIVVERVNINPTLADARFAKPDPLVVDSAPAPVQAKPPDGAADPHAGHTDAPKPLKRATRSTADYKLPSVSLLRDDGKPVTLPAELDDGRVVVLNFVFTTCGTICPVMSQVFSQLQDRLGADRTKVHLVSVSIDPEHDRPARLAEYAKRYHASPQWRQYTGTVEASVAVQRAFDAYRGEKMNHTPVTYLRVAPGRRWVRLDGFASADELASEVHELLVSH